MEVSPHPSWQRAEKFLAANAWIIAWCIIALGLFLRWDQLGDYWLNPDEAINYSAATSQTWEQIRQEVTGNAHPPFFYILLRAFAWFGHDFLVLRLPSLIFGCLAIHGMYMAGRAFAGPLAGLIGALFLALMPAVIVQSQLIRPYMVLLAFLLYGIAYLGRYLSGKGGRNLIGYAVCMLFAILSHYSAFLVMGSLALMFAVMMVTKTIDTRQVRDLILASLVPGVAMILLYILHIRPTLQGGDLQAEALQFWMSAYMVTDVSEAWRNTQGLLRYLFGFKHAGTVFLILCGGLALAVERRKTFIYGLPLAGLVIALGLSFTSFYPYGDSRHSIYLITFLLIPASYGISQSLLAGPRPALISLAVLVVLLLVPAIGNFIMVGGKVKIEFLDERLSGTKGFRAVVEPPVRALQENGGIMILSMQSYYLLLPLFIEERETAQWHGIHPNSYRTFAFGKCDVVVSSDWDMSASKAKQDQPQSLANLIKNVTEFTEDLRIGERRDVWVMVGGWDLPLADDLLQLHIARGSNLLSKSFKLADRKPLAINSDRMLPSFLGFRVDMPRYLELMK